MSLTCEQFKLYIYTISHADDEGRMSVSIPMMHSRCYPLHLKEISEEDTEKDLKKLKDSNLVILYGDDGKYLAHPNWKRYQSINKPQPSKLPPPPEDYGSTTVALPPNRIEENRIEKKEYAPTVHLCVDEYNKLVDKYGLPATKKMIEKLSNYKGAKGKKYKDDYRAILNWVVDAVGVKAETTGWKCKKCGNVHTAGYTGIICLRCKEER